MIVRIGHPAISRAATWRGLLMVLLLLALVVAPVARAACAIEHVALAAGDTSPASSVADSAFSSGSSAPEECCIEQAQAVAAPDAVGAQSAGFTVSPVPDAPPRAHFALGQPAALLISIAHRRPPSPYESVSRRVRRLLI
ncbi:MAG TPA: hypothetical protein VFR86_16730 [Burkholderiaceae bacterium]|nr:hypothetical protein [Burkholderiaceae bacterium]